MLGTTKEMAGKCNCDLDVPASFQVGRHARGRGLILLLTLCASVGTPVVERFALRNRR